MTRWCRLWEDMANDPKWRTVAKRSGRPTPEVMAVFVHMMVNASASETRGSLESWSDEDVAIALDMETEHVEAIRSAMQGKLLDDKRLTGWDKRQPVREDNSAERAKAWREHKKTLENAPKQPKTKGDESERLRTQPNATEPPDTDTDTEKVTSSLRSDDCPEPAKPARAKHAYSDEFGEFWTGYPTDQNMSKHDAWKVWQRLTPEDRKLATAALPGFKAYCRKYADYRPIYADRFLSKRRFDGYVTQASGGTAAKQEPRVDFSGGFSAPLSTIRENLNRDFWPAQWGPKIGDPGCRVPEEYWPEVLPKKPRSEHPTLEVFH